MKMIHRGDDMAYCDYYYYTSSWFSLQGYCKKKEELGERDSRVTSDEEKQYCEGYTSYKNCPVYNSSNSGSLCIVTQVLCYCKGLSDRCRTMMAIRAFRDNVLASTEEGKAMINEYYAVSESFALRLKTLSKEDRQGILERFYEKYIAPCIEEIQNGRNSAAIEIYSNMISEARAI